MAKERGGPQLVPRPSSWTPGRPPPWADLSPKERHVDLDRILRTLRGTPGAVPLAEGHGMRSSAVLIPVFEEAGRAWLVMTRRAQHLRTHRGEVSFPGGRQEEGEPLADTAKREAWEEIGLDPETVRIVAELDHFSTLASASAIAPFVGVLSGRPTGLRPSPDEVELILTLPFDELLEDGAYHEEEWTIGDRPATMAFFEVVGDTIWGATARILRHLLANIMATP